MAYTRTREGDHGAAGGGGAAARLPRYVPAALVYLLATLFTDAHFMADTADYVESIVAFEQGRYYNFWEFGHLLWRPLGWLCYRLLRPLANWAAGGDALEGVTWTLMALNWVAGLAAVLLVRAVAGRVVGGGRRASWVAHVAAAAFAFSQGFLNNAQTGSAYVPGLTCLLLGLYFLTKEEGVGDAAAGGGGTADVGRTRGWRMGAAAAGGVALALSVCLWLPYLWALPGALAAPLLLPFAGDRRARLRFVLCAALVCAAVGAAAYLCGMTLAGVRDLAGLREWIAVSSHGNTTKGLGRAVFGLARSFVNMGNDGVLFKRYLLHDTYNPVSLWALVRLSLVKLALLYLWLGAVAITLLLRRRGGGGGVLCWLLAGSLPIFAFATLFDGGAIERYLPLYPFVFVSLAFALDKVRAGRAAALAGVAIVCALAVVNGGAMLKPVLARRHESSARRIDGLRPKLTPRSHVYAVTWLDDLINFNRSFPFHPANRGGQMKLYALVTPGTSQTARWREEFAAQALAVWRGGGDVWVSRRAFATRPEPDWNWVEGDDPNMSWRDFNAFFAPLDAGETVGGDDGFVLLPPSPANVRALSAWAARSPGAAPAPARVSLFRTGAAARKKSVPAPGAGAGRILRRREHSTFPSLAARPPGRAAELRPLD